MLAENIKALRQQKGYSQETLAGQLNVVRQTVSKWEQGRSLPDAELLGRLAEVLEVPVSKLRGDSVPEAEGEGGYAQVAQQLAILNEQLQSERHDIFERYRKSGGANRGRHGRTAAPSMEARNES